jgi:uncharacterized protein
VIVVGDASPLISLGAVGQLGLLKALYGRVLVPEAVHQEVTSQPERPGAREVADADWIVVQPVRDRSRVDMVNLGRGESEAIALVIEANADLLIVDERRARSRARQANIEVIGSAGVLLEARSRQLIPSVKLVIDEMISRGVLRMHPALYAGILKSAGEQP